MKTLTANSIMSLPVKMAKFEGAAYIAHVMDGNRNAVHVAIDPGTAAILYEIAKAILIRLGVKALTKLLGLSDTGKDEQFFRELLLDIADILRMGLDEAEIKRATSEMQGLNVLMREYMASPDTSKFRLEACVTQSALVLKRLENLLPLSANAYILGILVRLAAIQEIAILTKSTTEDQNVRRFAADSLPHLKNALDSLALKNENRVSPIQVEKKYELRSEWSLNSVTEKNFQIEKEPSIEREPPETRPSRYAIVSIFYSADGVVRSFYKEERMGNVDELAKQLLPKATAAHELDSMRVRQDFISRIGIPIRQSIAEIESISQLEF